MKGLELPISMIVIIAIAVLVLTVLAVFFTGSFGDSANVFERRAALTNGCNILRGVYSCSAASVSAVNNIEYSGPGSTGGRINLIDLCFQEGAALGDAAACARLCGCPGN